MNMDFETIITSIKQFVAVYVQIFVGILSSPMQTFSSLLDTEREEKFTVKVKKLDATPFIYASISLLIGLVLGSSLSIKDAPSEITTNVIVGTIVPCLFLWLLYGLVIHFFVKLFNGKGKIEDTIGGVIYVLGTLHPLLLLFIYILSAIYPNSLSYDLTLRDPTVYGGIPEWARVDIIGFNFRIFYYLVSFILTAIYLYFPLSLIHKLSFIKLLIVYIIGFAATLFLALITLLLTILAFFH